MKKLRKGLPASRTETDQAPSPQTSSLGMIACSLAFLFCILVGLAPLNRLVGVDYMRSLPFSAWLLVIGTWLPLDLSLSSNTRESELSTHLILFLGMIALAFCIYSFCAWWIGRQPANRSQCTSLRWIRAITLLAGLAFVFTPAMLSHDPFVYAGYGRVLAVHHANPYFVTLSAYPADPLMRLDDWNNVPAAYGPFWLLVCALSTFLAGSNPLAYILFYRLLALAAHLINTMLVAAILRRMGCSQRTIALGTLFYAWNPLILQESSLGAHNDTLMVTLLLLGLFFWIRYEQYSTVYRLHHALPSLVAFTLAALIKFTAAPLIVFFLLLLARTAIIHNKSLRSALLLLFTGGIISGGIALILYAPFWIGHSIQEISGSFTSPPSANAAYGSILSALHNWIKVHGWSSGSAFEGPLRFFSQHKTWQTINLVVLLTLMLCGNLWLWRNPTTRTLALASLAVLGALLIVTPWFFPWYVTWLVGLAAVGLPIHRSRLGRALVGGTLAFSASAFCIYLFRGLPPLGDWGGPTPLSTVGPPLLTFLLLLLLPRRIQGKENQVIPHKNNEA
jgi:hypothetical protein